MVMYDNWAKTVAPNKPKSYYLYYNSTFMIGTENGTGSLKKELSVGMSVSIGEPTRLNNIYNNLGDDRYQLGITGSFGLRYYMKRIPLFGKLSYTPFYAIAEKKLYPIWFGLAVGVNFGKQTK